MDHAWADVLKAIIRRHNWAHVAKDKGVSNKTMVERENFLFAFFHELRKNEDIRHRVDPRRLGNRHIRFMVNRWLERQLAPATFQQYMSFLRTFSVWIGKPQLVMDIERYIDDPERYRRTYCAVKDKSWSARGVDAERMFETMRAIDRYAAAQLAVKSAFGLRRKEAVMLQPHRQVVTALQAGIKDAVCEFYLDLRKGTKGGRRRYLPIDTDRKRLAIGRARDVARGPNDHLGDPARTLKQNLCRIDYVMAKLGITQQDLGITAHGLRHEYANDLYELLDDRVGGRSTLITSQLPIEHWHDYIGDPTLADAILDRLLHNAHKIHLEGESMRKRDISNEKRPQEKSRKPGTKLTQRDRSV